MKGYNESRAIGAWFDGREKERYAKSLVTPLKSYKVVTHVPFFCPSQHRYLCPLSSYILISRSLAVADYLASQPLCDVHNRTNNPRHAFLRTHDY